jgi:hypothetical protein
MITVQEALMSDHHTHAPERAPPHAESHSAALDESPPRVEVPPGTELVLELEGVYGHLKSELVGYRATSYIVIRTPVGPPGFGAKLFRGNSLVVRYLDEGRACGFQTSILHLTLEPEPLLFLACPRLMQEKSLRSAQRLDTYLLCKAALRNHTVDGTLIDISRHGYRCILPSHVSDGILHPDIGEQIVLSADLGGTQVKLLGSVRNVAQFPASVRLGVAFEGNDRATEQHVIEFLIKEGVEA